MSIQTIESQFLTSITGGTARNTRRTTTTAQPNQTQQQRPNIGGELLKGCLTGAGGSIKQGVRPEDIASGCLTGAGKSVLEGLGGLFGGKSK